MTPPPPSAVVKTMRRGIRRGRYLFLSLILVILALAAVLARNSIPFLRRQWKAQSLDKVVSLKPNGLNHKVKVYANIKYLENPADRDRKHELDLYIPVDSEHFPTVIFVHGGGWRSGDKNYTYDLYGNVGKAFAEKGIGCAIINYRLAPDYTHPAQIEDVTAAFAWLKRNIARYSGDPDRLFLAGHSAGAHLISLLVSDESYLEQKGLTVGSVRGVIAISGLYDLTEGMAGLGKIPEMLYIEPAFGKDEQGLKDASPIFHIHPGGPPFLLIVASSDPSIIQNQSERFRKALVAAKVHVEGVYRIRTWHDLEIMNVGVEGDRITELMVNFVQRLAGNQGRSTKP